MSKACAICGKTTMSGRKYKRRGMAKAKSGAGIKITGKTARVFLPNLQKVRILLDGVVQRTFVCTKCIKADKITKA